MKPSQTHPAEAVSDEDIIRIIDGFGSSFWAYAAYEQDHMLKIARAILALAATPVAAQPASEDYQRGWQDGRIATSEARAAVEALDREAAAVEPANAEPKHADIYAALRAAGLSLVKTVHGLHVVKLIEGEASAAPMEDQADVQRAYEQGRFDEQAAQGPVPYPDDAEPVAPQAAVDPNCSTCQGTGVDGDVGERGETIDVDCHCRSTWRQRWLAAGKKDSKAEPVAPAKEDPYDLGRLHECATDTVGPAPESDPLPDQDALEEAALRSLESPANKDHGHDAESFCAGYVEAHADIRAAQPAKGFDAVSLIVRGCCEAEKSDPDHQDTICIRVDDLRAIVECHLVAEPVEGAEPVAWLLPCPFCKGDRARIADNEGSALHVNCRDCGAQMWGHKAHFGSFAEAGAAWNRRDGSHPAPASAQAGAVPEHKPTLHETPYSRQLAKERQNKEQS